MAIDFLWLIILEYSFINPLKSFLSSKWIPGPLLFNCLHAILNSSLFIELLLNKSCTEISNDNIKSPKSFSWIVIHLAGSKLPFFFFTISLNLNSSIVIISELDKLDTVFLLYFLKIFVYHIHCYILYKIIMKIFGWSPSCNHKFSY